MKVIYTVKPEFVNDNIQNIHTFMDDVKKINNQGIRYAVLLGADGKTFIHLSSFDKDSSQKALLELESFKTFQKRRDASGLEVQPSIEEMSLVAASFPVLD